MHSRQSGTAADCHCPDGSCVVKVVEIVGNHTAQQILSNRISLDNHRYACGPIVTYYNETTMNISIRTGLIFLAGALAALLMLRWAEWFSTPPPDRRRLVSYSMLDHFNRSLRL